MDIFVRTARLADVEFITPLCNQLGYQSTNAETEKRLSFVFQDANSCVFVAIANERVVGWIHGFYSARVESDPFIEIGGLVTDENHRRKKIGKLLVDKIVEWGREKGNLKLRVRCNKMRIDSHQFYFALGFNEIKEQKIFEMKLSS